MRKSALAAMLLFGVLSGCLASGHHSWPATYDLDRIVRIEGEVTRFTFRNPHSHVWIEVGSEPGEVGVWDAEWGGIYELGGQGVVRGTLRPGEVLVVTGHPGRDVRARKLRILTIERPADGFKWGTRPGEVFN